MEPGIGQYIISPRGNNLLKQKILILIFECVCDFQYLKNKNENGMLHFLIQLNPLAEGSFTFCI